VSSLTRGRDILHSQIRCFPHLEGQVRVFTSTRNKVAQLYSQALGFFFFVTSYDSHGYGGGIRTKMKDKFGVMLRPTISRSVCLGIRRPPGAQDHIFITVRQLQVSLMWGPLSDERKGLSFARVTVGSKKSVVNMYNLHFTCF
jgi:hypothetical protein